MYLIEKLIGGDISFQAQIKIPKDNDPLITIFRVLLEGELGGKEDHQVLCLYYWKYFSTSPRFFLLLSIAPVRGKISQEYPCYRTSPFF